MSGARGKLLDVALVTGGDMPEVDVDEAMLVDALADRGLGVRVVAWNDPGFDWSIARMAVVRSTWDYHQRLDEFENWIRRAAELTQLHNPAATMLGTVRKRYLVDFAERGLPVVPTEFVAVDDPRGSEELLAATGWSRVVVKPEVSGGSWRTVVADAADAGEHLDALRRDERDVLVQPYLESVDGHGERCLVFIDGVLCHAIRKDPRFAGSEESVSKVAVDIAPEEAAFARRVLDVAGANDLLYARVDIARGADDELLLMELELVEPSLFLLQQPSTVERFADVIAARLAT